MGPMLAVFDYKLQLREGWSLILIWRLVVMGVEEKAVGLLNCERCQ